MGGILVLTITFFLLNVSYSLPAHFNPGHYYTIPQRVFTATCEAEALNSVESSEWSFLVKSKQIAINDTCHRDSSFVNNGTRYRKTQIEGKFEVENKRITSFFCRSASNESWIEYKFQGTFKFPGTLVFRSRCFSQDRDRVVAIVGIGEPPAAPQSISCTNKAYETMQCRWNMPISSKNTLESSKIYYTMIINSTTRTMSGTGCSNTSETCCTTNLTSITAREGTIGEILFKNNMEITIVAQNEFSMNKSSINCFPPVFPNGPLEQMSTESTYSRGKQQVNLTTKFRLDHVTDSKMSELKALDLDIEYLFTNEALDTIRKNIQEHKHKRRQQTDPPFCKQELQPELDIPKIDTNGCWISEKHRVDGTIRQFQKIDAIANATLVIRARYRFHGHKDSCKENFWSPFSYSTPNETEPIKPGKLIMSILWWHNRGPSTAYDVPTPHTVMMIVYEKNLNLRYTYNKHIDEFVWSINCTGSNKFEATQLSGCDFQLQAKNEVGLSEPETLRLAQDSYCRIENITISKETLHAANFQFAISSNPTKPSLNCSHVHSQVESEKCSIVTFYWEIRRNMYSMEDVMIINRKQTPIGNYHVTPFYENEGNKPNEKIVFPWFSNGSFTERSESGYSKPRVSYTTSSITRNKNGIYNTSIQFLYNESAIYGLAFSLKCRNTLFPATVFQNEFTFKKQAPKSPSSVYIKALSSTSIGVTWSPLALEKQGAHICAYRIYVSEKPMYKTSERAVSKATCQEMCQNQSYYQKNISNCDDANTWSKNDILRSFNRSHKHHYVVTDLKEDTMYYVAVSAVNFKGESPCSEPAKEKTKFHDNNTAYLVVGIFSCILLVAGIIIYSSRHRLRKWVWPKVPKPIMFINWDTIEDPNVRMSCLQETEIIEHATPYIPKKDGLVKSSSETSLLDKPRPPMERPEILDSDTDEEKNDFGSNTARLSDSKERNDGYIDTNEALIMGRGHVKDIYLQYHRGKENECS